MEFLRSTSAPAKTALIYITVGTLIMIWTGVYFAYHYNSDSNPDPVNYWISGAMATGLALVVIGLATGQIGRSAKPAESELPPITTPPVAVAEGQTTDHNPPVAVVAAQPPHVVQAARPMQPNTTNHPVGV